MEGRNTLNWTCINCLKCLEDFTYELIEDSTAKLFVVVGAVFGVFWGCFFGPKGPDCAFCCCEDDFTE